MDSVAYSALCKELEHFETPRWAADEILKHEILSGFVLDPCVGSGVLADAASRAGYGLILGTDIHDWGWRPPIDAAKFMQADFLTDERIPPVFIGGLPVTVFMNPPFSKAEEFVRRALAMGARKVVCFQRFSWWESQSRRAFWDEFPPNRVFICGDRADCWRFDLKKNEKGRRLDPKTGKELSGTSTAHAWFVWEKGQIPGTLLHRIYRSK